MTRNSARGKILLAATQVLAREGASNLTLEAVAREAGVSKGGLLYHFHTKEALVTGMLEAVNYEFDQALVREEAVESPGPGRFLRAYIRASFAYEQGLYPMVSGLLAAVANQPELLAPFQAAFRGWQERLENDGLDPLQATMVRLAVDGLWFADLFQLASPQGAEREKLAQRLLELSRP